jgi:hypothetical protein
MAVFQKASGTCTGRGFVATDANGYCKKFYDWITTAPGSGGPGWYILLDRSASPTGKNFTVPDHTNDKCYSVAHGFLTGEAIVYTNAGGAAPGGMGIGTTYYAIPIDADNFYIATTYDNALNGTKVNITSAGSGTHTATLDGPYIIVSNVASPAINEVCHIVKIGFKTATGTRVIADFYLGWTPTGTIPCGWWQSVYLTTLDSADFAYDFRVGDECFILQTRLGTTWYTIAMDTWDGDANLVETTDKTGVVQSGVSAGSSVVLQLDTGEAANFTQDNYYFIYDFTSHNWVDYVKVTNVNTGADQITVDAIRYAYPAGAVIAAYTHRFFCSRAISSVGSFNGYSTIPYYSNVADRTKVFFVAGAVGSDYTAGTSFEAGYITSMSPNDMGKYALEKANIVEVTTYPNYPTANRGYGACRNLFLCAVLTMAAGLDGRSYGGKNYLYFQISSYLFTSNGSGTVAVLFLDTVSAS